MNINIKKCQRCGADHDDLKFEPLSNPVDDYSYWGVCPLTRQPIMMKIVEKDDQPKPEVRSVHISAIGQFLVVDKDGKQIPELQDHNLLLTWIDLARSKGYELAGIRILTNSHCYRVMKIDDKYSIEAEV